MSFILNIVYNVQHKSNKALAFKGVQGTAGRVDLMIVDIPKDLSISIRDSLNR